MPIPLNLSTRAGLEIEVNGADTLQVAHAIREAVGGEFTDSGEEDTFHVIDPQGRVWKSKPDGTCETEFNSPPLATHTDVADTMRVVENIRRRTSGSVAGNTGMHWHLDMAALSPKQIVYFTALMHRHQPFIYQAFRVFSPRLDFCSPMSSAHMGALLRTAASDRHQLANAFGALNRDRDIFVNLQNLAQGGLGTAELRCFNSTFNPVMIGAALCLGQRAFQVARQSRQDAPLTWDSSINSADAFAQDFGLAPDSTLLNVMKNEANRQDTWLERVINDPDSFKDLPFEARDDEEVALAAVSTHGMALEFVSDRLKRNERIVKAACIQDGEALSVADPALRGNFNFVYQLMDICPDALEHADDALRNHPQIVARAMHCMSAALEFAGNEILSDFAFMQWAVQQDPFSLFYVKQIPEEAYFSLARQALRANSGAIRCIPEPLRGDARLSFFAPESEIGSSQAGPSLRTAALSDADTQSLHRASM